MPVDEHRTTAGTRFSASIIVSKNSCVQRGTMTAANEDDDTDSQSVTFADILETVEKIIDLDDQRQEVFREELDAEADRYPQTRDVISNQQDQIRQLKDHLQAESENLAELIDRTEYLSTDQAVRHREESIRKIRQHNEALERFTSEMNTMLETFEANLDRLESHGMDAELQDTQPYLEAAKQALEDHNDVVEGLDTNLRILHAYTL